jgi:hypothetical protein
MNTYIGIWIDHRRAYIVSCNKSRLEFEQEEKETVITIESGVEKHLRLSGGARTRNTPYGPQDIAVDSKIDDRRKHQLQDYYQDIIRRIQGAKKILIFGPGEAKRELEKEIKKSKALSQKISAVETTDKMTERQIAAKTRKFFASYT